MQFFACNIYLVNCIVKRIYFLFFTDLLFWLKIVAKLNPKTWAACPSVIQCHTVFVDYWDTQPCPLFIFYCVSACVVCALYLSFSSSSSWPNWIPKLAPHTQVTSHRRPYATGKRQSFNFIRPNDLWLSRTTHTRSWADLCCEIWAARLDMGSWVAWSLASLCLNARYAQASLLQPLYLVYVGRARNVPPLLISCSVEILGSFASGSLILCCLLTNYF